MAFKKLDKVKWGIIGAGDVCEVKSGPAFNLAGNSYLQSIMRRNREKASDYASRHHVPQWYDDADQLINDPLVNVIYIATPPDTHKYYTLKAAAAGKPVYVEKPMARTHQECLDMIDACSNAQVPLFVAYYRRTLPNFVRIKELVESGIIGEIRYVDIKLNKTLQPDIVGASTKKGNWRVDPEIAGGGYFYDLASHQLDFLDYLFGPVVEAHGIAENQAGLYPAEDLVIGSFRFENGVIGQGNWCFSTSEISESDLTTIVGSKGQISFPYFGDHSVTLEVEGKEKQIFTFKIPGHIQQYLIQTIVNELTGSGKCPSTGITGARTNKVMGMISKKVK